MFAMVFEVVARAFLDHSYRVVRVFAVAARTLL